MYSTIVIYLAFHLSFFKSVNANKCLKLIYTYLTNNLNIVYKSLFLGYELNIKPFNFIKIIIHNMLTTN